MGGWGCLSGLSAAACDRAAAGGSRAAARYNARGIALGAPCSIGRARVSAARTDISDSAARHTRAVTQTLGWADEAAARGDYGGALAWLRTLEMIGDELSDAYQAKRQSWRLTLGTRTPE